MEYFGLSGEISKSTFLLCYELRAKGTLTLLGTLNKPSIGERNGFSFV
jgi:hypothetical protein